MNTLYYLIAGGGLLLFVVLLLWISGNKPSFIPDFPINIIQAPKKRGRKRLPKGAIKLSEIPFDTYEEKAFEVERLKELKKEHPGTRFYHKWIDMPYSYSGGEYTIRPYTQGMGCDSTTSNNIYLQAKAYSEKRGWDFKKIHKEVFHDEADTWIDNLDAVRKETIIPRDISPWLLFADLRDINSYDMAVYLEDRARKEGVLYDFELRKKVKKR